VEFYFTDRQYNVIGVGSTGATAPLRVANETEQQSTNAATIALNGTLYFTKKLLPKATKMAATGNYILYEDDQGNDQFLTILESHVSASSESISFAGDSAGNDLRNETVNSYTASKAMTFAQYFATVANDSGWEIGVNEAANNTRTLSWEGEQTAYERLLSIATEFGVDVEFSFVIDGTNPVKRYVNVKKSIGSDNFVTLSVGKELNSITIDTDMYDMYNAVYAIGGTPDGSDTAITLKGYKWTDPTGRYVLTADGSLRDTVSVRTWSRLRSNSNPTPTDSYLNRVKNYDAVTQATLLQSALADLKKYCSPAVNYTLDIASLPDNVHKGDTVHLEDEEQDLHLSGTVLDITRCFSTGVIMATIGNYKIEANKIEPKLLDMANTLKKLKAQKRYWPWTRYADDDQGNGMSALADGKSYMATVWGTNSTPSDNISDYAGHWTKLGGKDGADGKPGPKGGDGKTPYFHIAYADSSDGNTNFSLDTPGSRKYIGSYTDFTQTDSKSPSAYHWQLVQGPKGDTGKDGATGVAGKAGADGKTPYLHTAWANSADGINGFSTGNDDIVKWDKLTSSSFTTDTPEFSKWSFSSGIVSVENTSASPQEGSRVYIQGSVFDNTPEIISVQAKADKPATTYIGSYLDKRAISVGTDWANYNFSIAIGGAVSLYSQAPGITFQFRNVSVIHDYAYRGEYTDYTANDSTDPTKYTWVKVKGEPGAQGIQGLQGLQGPQGDQGIQGPDGKPSYTHIAYANSANGVTNFSTSDSNRTYIGMYVDFNIKDSTTPSDYSWTLVKGADGAQGTPGKAGSDGKTPYFHQAWADSSDGSTNFSTMVSLGKKYLGTYTDYVVADSKDPKQYKWTELVGAIKIGGTNLYLSSKMITDAYGINGNATVTVETFDSTTNMWHIVAAQGNGDGVGISIGDYANGKIPNNSDWSYSADIKGTGKVTSFGIEASDKNPVVGTVGSEWSRISQTGHVNEPQTKTIIMYFDTTSSPLDVYIKLPKLELGNMPTAWSPAPEDVQTQVDDQEARLESAELSITPDAITSTVLGSDDFQTFSDANAEDKQALTDTLGSLQDDQQASLSRLATVEQTANGVKTSVDTMATKVDAQGKTVANVENYMNFDSDGLSLGKSDSSLTVNINNQQMTFKDGGKQVAYINGQMMYISDLQVLNSIKLGYHKISKYSDDGATTAITFAGA
jgi:phage minor structural protein